MVLGGGGTYRLRRNCCYGQSLRIRFCARLQSRLHSNGGGPSVAKTGRWSAGIMDWMNRMTQTDIQILSEIIYMNASRRRVPKFTRQPPTLEISSKKTTEHAKGPYFSLRVSAFFLTIPGDDKKYNIWRYIPKICDQR